MLSDWDFWGLVSLVLFKIIVEIAVCIEDFVW